MEFEEFAKFFESILYAYYNNPQLEKTIIYYHVLKDYDLDVVKTAFMKIIKRSKYFPTVSEVVKEIEKKRDIRDMALIAYLKVINAMNRIGPYKSIIFDDPVIHLVVDALGGWAEISKIPISQVERFKAEFINLYTIFSEKADLIEANKVVKGLTDEVVHVGGKKDDRKAIAK